MNFLTMEYFAMAAKEKSITKAADKLHITQQTLSAAISNLEKEVGNQLFIRHVPLELTYAGDVFYRYAESFIRTQTSLLREMQDIAHNEKGILRIGIGNTRGRAIMPGMIDAFGRKYPNYSIEITEGSNQALQKSLSQGEIDAAIAVFSEEFPDLDLYEGYEESTVLIISKELFTALFEAKEVTESDTELPVQSVHTGGGNAAERLQTTEQRIRLALLEGNLQDFQNCPFVLCRTADMTGKVANYFLRRSHITPPIKAHSDNIETLISLCERGVGACFCPDNLLYATLSSERLERLHIFTLPKDASYDVRFGKQKGNNWQIVSAFYSVFQQFLTQMPRKS